MRKQNLLLLIIGIFTFGSILSQNPFRSLGIPDEDVKILTLSKGKYQEFHDDNLFERVGSAVINMSTGKIAYFIDRDTLLTETMLEPDISSRFISIDPMAEKYPEWSPYVYVANNPVVLVDPDGRIWEPSDAIKNSNAYSLAMNTGQGQNLRTMFTTGSMKNHVYKIRGANLMQDCGGSGMGFMKDGRYLPINAITANDISSDLQLVFSVSVSNRNLSSISGSEIFGHESFIHNLRKISKSKQLLDLVGNAPNSDIASALILISNQSDFTDKNGGKTTTGGQKDHVKFLLGKKGAYNKYIGQLMGNATPEKQGELMGAINSYVNDLINNGDKNVQRYVGTEAQEVFKQLQNEFE